MIDQQTVLEGYPVVVELPVLWGQMDAFQHVNNTVYFRYFESARIAYADQIKMYQFIEEEGIGPILSATSCTFLKPLRYPDTVLAGCRTTRLTPSELEQEYAVHSRRLHKLAAVGTATVVAYDYRAGKRAEFPQALIRRMLELEKGLRLS